MRSKKLITSDLDNKFFDFDFEKIHNDDLI